MPCLASGSCPQGWWYSDASHGCTPTQPDARGRWLDMNWHTYLLRVALTAWLAWGPPPQRSSPKDMKMEVAAVSKPQAGRADAALPYALLPDYRIGPGDVLAI